ncbi:PQQ-binding-like beta-propeller repeat protein [Nonomuraea sp. NPDC050451]|uniref:caspase, EACC1-associated type n=1 Tax=Nonomuraea sp. NPDC050451 TaxID=3364364 RepID=UPI00379F356B
MPDAGLDLARSRAVLIGTGSYRHLPPVPAALHSLARMESLLTGELCGWPADRLSVFPDPPEPGGLPDQLVELFHAVEDVALFYYVGHGQVDPQDTLCLGLVKSRTAAERRRYTSLAFDTVRYALTNSRAKVKIVILDCCYAGLAAQPALSANDVSDRTRGTGAYTLAAAGEFALAWYETDPAVPTPQTYFTKYFADVIETGIAGEGPGLRLEPIFHEVVEALARDGKPAPTSRATDRAARFVFARNRAYRLSPADELHHRLSMEPPGKVTVGPSDPSDNRTRPSRRTVLISGLAALTVLGAGGTLIRLLTASEPRPPRPGSLRWRFKTAGGVGSLPAVVDGTVYIGSGDYHLYALNAATGAQRWKYQTGANVYPPPVVADGSVYVGSDDKNIYALNAANGALRWRYQTGDLVAARASVVGGTVYAGNNHGTVYALNAATGALRWDYQTKGVIHGLGAAEKIVYVGSYDGNVYALGAATGDLVWSYSTGAGVGSRPAITGGTVYVGSDNDIYALDAATGTLRWKYPTGNYVYSSPVVADGVVYAGCGDRYVYAVDAADGTLRWKYQTGGAITASPAVADGVTYVGSSDGYLYALVAATGALAWRYQAENGVHSPAVADGVVYFGSEDTYVYALTLPH